MCVSVPGPDWAKSAIGHIGGSIIGGPIGGLAGFVKGSADAIGDVVKNATGSAAADVPPLPSPTPTMENPIASAETDQQRAKRLGILRLGLASTIATGGQGVTQPGLVSTPSLYSTGTKGKLGQ